MAMRYMALLDLDNAYATAINAKVVPCGVESFTSKQQVKDFINHVFSEGEMGVDMGASCDCGNSEGMYLLSTVCSKCGTTVVRTTATDLVFNTWLEIPEFLPPMLQPEAYMVLNTWMGSYQGSRLIDLFMTVGAQLPPQLESLFETGMWEFYNNFDNIINFLTKEYAPLKLKKKETKSRTTNDRTKYIPLFIKKYRHCLFARYFPILDQTMHVLNKQGTMSFVDASSELVMKTIIELTNIHYTYVESKNLPVIEQCAVDMIKSYYGYTDSIRASKLEKKQGLIRRQILASRCHFTYRGVITPITDASYGDELHLPWSIGVQELKLEIINLLVNRNKFTRQQALALFEKAKYKYDPLVDELMKILIDECPFKGLPGLLGRNPSLNLGALQLLYTTRVKTDTADDSISLSPLILKAPNADFDGDALNGTLIKEMDDVENYMGFHPMMTMLTKDVLGISFNVNMGHQGCVNLSTWLNREPNAA